MNMAVSFNHVDHSDALQFFINQKSDNLKKLLWKGEHFDWIVENDAKFFKLNLNIKLRNKKIKVSAKNENAFSAVNQIIEKAKRLISEDHQRLRLLH